MKEKFGKTWKNVKILGPHLCVRHFPLLSISLPKDTKSFENSYFLAKKNFIFLKTPKTKVECLSVSNLNPSEKFEK